jgi:hypothetical protein
MNYSNLNLQADIHNTGPEAQGIAVKPPNRFWLVLSSAVG